MNKLKVIVTNVQDNNVLGLLNENEVSCSFYLNRFNGKYSVDLVSMNYIENHKSIDVESMKELGLEIDLRSAKIAYLRYVIVKRKKEKIKRQNKLTRQYENSRLLKLYNELSELDDICNRSITTLDKYLNSNSLTVIITYKDDQGHGSYHIKDDNDDWRNFTGFNINNFDCKKSKVKNHKTIIKNIRKYYEDKLEDIKEIKEVEDNIEINFEKMQSIFKNIKINKTTNPTAFNVSINGFNNITMYYYPNIEEVQLFDKRMTYKQANNLFSAMLNI